MLSLLPRTLKQHTAFFAALCVVFFFSTITVFASNHGGTEDTNMFESGIQKVLWAVVNNFFGWLVGIGGMILDYAIENFVIGFGDNYLNTGVGLAVDNMWVVVRDLFNITFIFALVYLGFKMILNSDDASTKKWLVNIILAALLVNFSLFITKFIVDFSNILAVQVVENGFGDQQISNTFAQMIGLSGVWAANDLPQLAEGAGYGYIFGVAMVFLIAAFVFAAGGLMLIIRYVALSVYLVLSPLMFLGMVFPNFKSTTSKYWSGFLGRAFYAPVYVLLVFMAAQIVNSLQQSLGTPNFVGATGALGGDAVGDSFEATFIPFILAAAFLIAAIVVAGKLSADGASASMKAGQYLTGRAKRFAGGATAGFAAAGIRNTAGRGANTLANSQRFKTFAANYERSGGRTAMRLAQGTAASSFDVRRAGGLGKSLGIGEGKKGGYAQSVKDKNKADEKFAESVSVAKSFDDKNETTRAEIESKAKELRESEQFQKQKAEAKEKAKKKYEAEKAAADAEWEANERKAADAFKSGDTLAQQEAREKRAEIETRLAAIDTKIKREVDKLKTEIDKDITMRARGAVKYKNEIQVMKNLQSTQKFWNRADARFGGGYGGFKAGGAATGVGTYALGTSAATAATAGVAGGGIGFLLGASTAAAQADRANQSFENLKNKYGESGEKMIKNEDRKKKAKESMEILREEAGEDNSDSSDDKKDSES